MPAAGAGNDTPANVPSSPGSSAALRVTWAQSVKSFEAAGIEPGEAALEAEVLLRHVLEMDRVAFLVHLDDPLPPDAQIHFSLLLRRRLRREPLAYITGHRAFYGLDFLVDAHVLIPRPETEGLVERVIAYVRETSSRLSQPATVQAAGGRPGAMARCPGSWPTIVDAGTGSGCIAVALAVHLAGAPILAIDSSMEALALAYKNASLNGVAQSIRFLHGDLLQPLASKVDIIVANLPYVPGGEIDTLAPEIARYEPRAALDGGADGLDVIRRLLAQAREHLARGGAMFLEIGEGQGNEVARLAQAAFPAASVEIERDLAGLERYAIVEDAA